MTSWVAFCVHRTQPDWHMHCVLFEVFHFEEATQDLRFEFMTFRIVEYQDGETTKAVFEESGRCMYHLDSVTTYAPGGLPRHTPGWSQGCLGDPWARW